MSALRIVQATLSLLVVGLLCSIVFIKTISVLTPQPESVIQPPITVGSRSTPAELQIRAQAFRQQVPADLQIQSAQARFQKLPTEPDGYNRLAAAYMQKARETGDFGLNVKAESALKYSFKVAPDNYEAIKLQAVLLLTYHQFSEALSVLHHAQQLRPRDPEVYGAMTDAMVELGDYSGALWAVQRCSRCDQMPQPMLVSLIYARYMATRQARSPQCAWLPKLQILGTGRVLLGIGFNSVTN
jgi:cytochrome c-type biogenesis protein CcmH/NrfG